MPIGAVLGTERAMGFDDVSTGSTWSWLPAACVAALETLRIFRDEPILEHVRELDAVARAGARRRSQERYPCIGDVRVDGLFHRDRVREGSRDEGARPGSDGAGRARMPAPRAARRRQHDVDEPPAVAGHAGRGAASGGSRSWTRRSPRRSARRQPDASTLNDASTADCDRVVVQRHAETGRVERLRPFPAASIVIGVVTPNSNSSDGTARSKKLVRPNASITWRFADCTSV